MKYHLALLFFFITISAAAQSQHTSLPPINWQLLDWQKDGYPGMSVEKAYQELLAHKKPRKKIIVAIIDDGLDSTHPDLAGMQWTNTREKPGNGVDDDHNGYVDDVHGWNFVGNDRKETFEEIREYVRLKSRFENKDSVAVKSDPEYSYWRTIAAAKNNQFNSLHGTMEQMGKIIIAFQTLQDYWSKMLSTDSVSFAHIAQAPSFYIGADSTVLQARTFILSFKEHAKVTADSTRITSIINEVKPYADEAYKALSVADTILEGTIRVISEKFICMMIRIPTCTKDMATATPFPMTSMAPSVPVLLRLCAIIISVATA